MVFKKFGSLVLVLDHKTSLKKSEGKTIIKRKLGHILNHSFLHMTPGIGICKMQYVVDIFLHVEFRDWHERPS